MSRGTHVQIGDLPGERCISAQAEAEAVAKRLRHAAKSNDVSVLQSAIGCAGEVFEMLSWDTSLSPDIAKEIWDLTSKIRHRLDTDTELLRFGALRRSASIKQKVRRLWEIMVLESQDEAPAPDAPAEATREGYRRFHSRLAKALMQAERFSLAIVELTADTDWADDISRYAGTSHITIWLSMIREAFRAGAGEAVAQQGFTALFARYDEDNSGDLSFSEFETAVRTDLGIAEETLTDKELTKIFAAVDVDGGETVGTAEFMRWLFIADDKKTQKKSSAKGRSIAQVKRRFKVASSAMIETVGWDFIFAKYDDDRSGELELNEFRRAVRQECELTREQVSDRDVKEIFGVIDTDGSGAISAEELRQLLNADLGDSSLTWGTFYSSILELTSVWSRTESPEQFVLFLQSLFDVITEPTNEEAKAFLESGGQSAELSIFADQEKITPNFQMKSMDDV